MGMRYIEAYPGQNISKDIGGKLGLAGFCICPLKFQVKFEVFGEAFDGL